MAPEYRLVGFRPDGSHAIALRDEWMKNARIFTHHAFSVETFDVNRAKNTAVASAHGVWTVSFRPREPATVIRFFVTHTWVRRNGQWQVIHRFSQRLPNPAAEAGRQVADCWRKNLVSSQARGIVRRRRGPTSGGSEC